MDATELFQICRQQAESGPSVEGLRQLHEVLVVACAAGVRTKGGTFGNLFSQIDFVCKQLGVGSQDRIALQTMRRHSNNRELLSREEWLYDLRALSLFVSAVFQEAVPGALLQLLPPQNRPIAKSQTEKRPYVRCIVRSWNDEQFTADTADGEITVNYGSPTAGRDFRYLGKILREGIQLNLLDLDPEPSLIVVEPDFLVDISSIAACFTPYGHHPLLYTVNRLKPRPNTQAILLGNFAGAALDDVIHRRVWQEARSERQEVRREDVEVRGGQQEDKRSGQSEVRREDVEVRGGQQEDTRSEREELGATLRRSFREQAIRFCACEDFRAEIFKCDADQQLRHIKEAVSVLFPFPTSFNSPLSSSLSSKVSQLSTLNSQLSTLNSQLSTLNSQPSPLLEPSFVCERLGLQGRVDLMTADMSLLVEQKAGKNMKIERQSHDTHGQQQESHYVQLLLYYGILRYNFGRTDQTVDTRLLYSRYPASQGLLSVNYYRTLFREALRFRNQLVATELLVAREGFGRILPLLSPDVIYKGVKPDGYFTQYVLPELLDLKSQIAALKPIERAYYERMMTFVYREQACQKLGNAENRLQHSGGCASDLWQMPLGEKLETGNILLSLTIEKREKSDEAGGFDLITLRRDETAEAVAENFRRGDMVYLYAYRDEPDVRKSILYKGTLDEITVDRLVVRLNDGQQDAQIFPLGDVKRWAVEHGSSDLSASSSIRSIHQFIMGEPRRRELLLGQRAPEAQSQLQLSRSYNPVYDPLLLRVRQSLDYFLLVGPPGTGKTSQALRFMIQEELHNGGTLLLTAYTNRAVDEICSMLEGEALPYLRIGNMASCDPRFRPHLLENVFAKPGITLQEMRKTIASMPIIVGTTATLQSRQEVLQLKHFSLCIVDEASQILEPSIVGLLSHPHIGRFVLVGDYKQLPAVVGQPQEDTLVTEQCLRDICLTDCRQSLFERLIQWERHCGRTQFVGTLDRQGRMHPDVALFPCEHFYADERLKPVPLPHQQASALSYTGTEKDPLDVLLHRQRVVFLGHQADLQVEAHIVADLLGRIYHYQEASFDADKTVGIIVTYRHQIALIRQEVARLGIPALQSVSIDTVERYQGSQRDVIIYSFGVLHHYQLSFLTANTFVENGRLIDRKLNVAMTRARRQLLMTGRQDVLVRNPLLAEIVSRYGSTAL